ncbi:hypothetical protein CAOG_010049 [Capsaspora owczarzaki ATCC 30864]|uniref:Calcineurin-like phosphoesterase domain-containing protein n=1 Tax=Capsaspora owczarzaki (strain ATCC 30864) TaxID=595528 RepID=A0A0D2VYG9_CAPO3|nr:hypothetical protein CAOG_010049 [Capsaspora owczarzaki ATCC 30864]
MRFRWQISALIVFLLALALCSVTESAPVHRSHRRSSEAFPGATTGGRSRPSKVGDSKDGRRAERSSFKPGRSRRAGVWDVYVQSDSAVGPIVPIVPLPSDPLLTGINSGQSLQSICTNCLNLMPVLLRLAQAPGNYSLQTSFSSVCDASLQLLGYNSKLICPGLAILYVPPADLALRTTTLTAPQICELLNYCVRFNTTIFSSFTNGTTQPPSSRGNPPVATSTGQAPPVNPTATSGLANNPSGTSLPSQSGPAPGITSATGSRGSTGAASLGNSPLASNSPPSSSSSGSSSRATTPPPSGASDDNSRLAATDTLRFSSSANTLRVSSSTETPRPSSSATGTVVINNTPPPMTPMRRYRRQVLKEASEQLAHAIRAMPTEATHSRFDTSARASFDDFPGVANIFRAKSTPRQLQQELASHRRQAPGSPTVRILHVTDVHLDLQYLNGSDATCGTYLCCHGSFGPGSAGTFGDYQCDLSIRTFNSFFAYINATFSYPGSPLPEGTAINGHIDYVLYGGDSVAHDMYNASWGRNLQMTQILARAFQKNMPGVPVIATIGNHDVYPDNLFNIATDGYILKALADVWEPWLDAPAKAAFSKYGTYSMLLRPGLRVLSFNSQYSYSVGTCISEVVFALFSLESFSNSL